MCIRKDGMTRKFRFAYRATRARAHQVENEHLEKDLKIEDSIKNRET